MIRHNNESGSVNISAGVYTDIVGTAVSNCFGVKGMAARSVTDGVYHLLRKEAAGKGVKVKFHEDNSTQIVFRPVGFPVRTIVTFFPVQTVVCHHLDVELMGMLRVIVTQILVFA